MLKAKSKPATHEQAALFAALGDNTRLVLVDRLGSTEHNSIAGLSAGMKLSRQGITKHLRVLESAGIVESTRVGREIRFTLKPASFTPMQEYLKAVSCQWDDTLSRLKSYVEEN